MLDHFNDQVNKKKSQGRDYNSTFPLTRTTGIMQFTDPALTTSSKSYTTKNHTNHNIRGLIQNEEIVVVKGDKVSTKPEN